MSAETLALDFALTRETFSLQIEEKISASGVTSIFGASGSGKTTLLRAIAGFETPDAGSISYAGSVWFDKAARINIRPEFRRAALVFQDARLFPHLTVRGNLQYALKRSVQTDATSLDGVIEQFELSPLLTRKPAMLSGGERQRVAIARALLSNPRLLMLDEPLAGLDAQRKSDILPFLDKLARQQATPIIYVSHDLRELARVSDHLILLADGRIRKSGPAKSLINNADGELFGGDDAVFSIIEATVKARDTRLGLARLEIKGGVLFVPLAEELGIGACVRLAVFAREVALSVQAPKGLSIQNVLHGIVREITAPEGAPYALVTLEIGGASLRARLTRAAIEQLGLEPGREAFALVKSATLEALPGD